MNNVPRFLYLNLLENALSGDIGGALFKPAMCSFLSDLIHHAFDSFVVVPTKYADKYPVSLMSNVL